MKRFYVALFVGLLAGLVGSVAMAVGNPSIAEETQLATRPTPVLSSFSVTSGTTIGASLSLNDVQYFRVQVCAADTLDPLQAVGTLKAYRLDERGTDVVPNKQLDLDLTLQAAGHCIGFPDQKVGVPYDRVMYAASGLKVQDGGTLLTQTDGGLDGGAFVIKIRGWRVP